MSMLAPASRSRYCSSVVVRVIRGARRTGWSIDWRVANVGTPKPSRVLAFHKVGPSDVWMEGIRSTPATGSPLGSSNTLAVDLAYHPFGDQCGEERLRVLDGMRVNPRKCTLTREKSHHLSHQAGASAALGRGTKSAKSFVFNGAEGGVCMARAVWWRLVPSGSEISLIHSLSWSLRAGSCCLVLGSSLAIG